MFLTCSVPPPPWFPRCAAPVLSSLIAPMCLLCSVLPPPWLPRCATPVLSSLLSDCPDLRHLYLCLFPVLNSIRHSAVLKIWWQAKLKWKHHHGTNPKTKFKLWISTLALQQWAVLYVKYSFLKPLWLHTVLHNTTCSLTHAASEKPSRTTVDDSKEILAQHEWTEF